MVKKYRAVVASIHNPVEGIYTVEFKSLTGAFRYAPGQFLHLALDHNYDGVGQWPASRCFSMQSNPDEENIRITYSVKGRFTVLMAEQLKPGSLVWLKLPYGDLFTRDHSKKNTVFIAGGTGITPFLSLFTHKSFNEYESPKVYLGFRSVELNTYQNELKYIRNSTVYVEYVYQNLDGPLDIQKIIIENGNGPDYFISGPPEMVRIFKSRLINEGFSMRQIKTDDWE